MSDGRARFTVGQVVCHRLFHYRGVIFDVDPTFQLSEEWYRHMARTRPPKEEPWYHVLVHGGEQTTYVAERNLEAEDEALPIRHPLIEHYFEGFHSGRYRPARTSH